MNPSTSLVAPCTTEDVRTWIRLTYEKLLHDKDIICPVCQDVFSGVVATAACGHRCCYACWIKIPTDSRYMRHCPTCRYSTIGCKKDISYADKLLKTKLDFTCKACKSETVFETLAEFTEHIRSGCQELQRKCAHCQVEFSLKETKHDECPSEFIACKQCPEHVSVRRKDMSAHMTTACMGTETKCDKCGRSCPRYKLQDHGCPEQQVACEYSKLGCKCQSMTRKDMALHILKPETMHDHMSLLLATIKQMQQQQQQQQQQQSKGWLNRLLQ